MSPLILKRASASRPSGQWRGNDYEVPTARPRMPSSHERFPAQFRQIERDHAGDCSCRATPQLATVAGGTTMKKTLTCLFAAVTIAAALAATATDASAQWRGRGWGGGWHGGWRGGGWGPGVAAGVVGGAVIAGAIIASRPPGYVVYPSYAQPVYGPGCYWASQPVYDGLGRVVGYMGRPVQVCPGYGPPPPPAPGYAGPPPAPPPTVELPPK